jgi:hypothetical protein
MAEPFPKGRNPRDYLAKHSERGESIRLRVTDSIIARAAGVSVAAAKKAITKDRLDPGSLESLVAFVAARRPDLCPTPRKPVVARLGAGHEAGAPGQGEQASRGAEGS